IGALADGYTAPAECTLCAPLATRAEFFDGACHKDPAGTACEGPRRVHEQGFEGIRALHRGTSSKWLSGVYHGSWDNLILESPLTTSHLSTKPKVTTRRLSPCISAP